MADDKRHRDTVNDFVSAYDERTRLFANLRNQKIDGDELALAITNYAAAAKTFDEARAAMLRK